MGKYWVLGTKKYIKIETLDKNVEILIHQFSVTSDIKQLTFKIEYNMKNNKPKTFIFCTTLDNFINFINKIADILKNFVNEIFLFDYYGPLDKEKKIFIKMK